MLGRRFQKISLQILKTALWLEVLMVMWIKILCLWCQCKWMKSWGSSSFWMLQAVTGLVFPDISEKNSASISKCWGVQAECPVWKTCGDIWTSKVSVSCLMLVHYEQCKIPVKVKPPPVIHPILTWISSLLSSRSSPRVCNLVKLIRRFVIFNRFCTSCEYGSSIGKLGGKTRKIICIEKTISVQMLVQHDTQTWCVQVCWSLMLPVAKIISNQ